MFFVDKVQQTLQIARGLSLLTDAEVHEVLLAFDVNSPFAAALDHAQCVHVHIKVDDTSVLSRPGLLIDGAMIDNEKEGYIKFAYPSGMNLIFSSIKVSEDELRETPDQRRARPFLDHFGIDLRNDSAEVRTVFDQIPVIADQIGFSRASQGAPGKAVFCCHVSVSEKHWVYPTRDGKRLVPVEVAFGPLVINGNASGCDLRPTDPSLGSAKPSCGERAARMS